MRSKDSWSEASPVESSNAPKSADFDLERSSINADRDPARSWSWPRRPSRRGELIRGSRLTSVSAISILAAAVSICVASRELLSWSSRSRAASVERAGLQSSKFPGRNEATQPVEFGAQVGMLIRGRGLALEGTELAANLAEQILDPEESLFGGVETTRRPLSAAAVLQHPGSLFDDRPSLLGIGGQDPVELTLADDHVLGSPDAGVREQLLDVEQATDDAVQLVLAVAGSEQRPADRHLGEVDRQLVVGVVDRRA